MGKLGIVFVVDNLFIVRIVVENRLLLVNINLIIISVVSKV